MHKLETSPLGEEVWLADEPLDRYLEEVPSRRATSPGILGRHVTYPAAQHVGCLKAGACRLTTRCLHATRVIRQKNGSGRQWHVLHITDARATAGEAALYDQREAAARRVARLRREVAKSPIAIARGSGTGLGLTGVIDQGWGSKVGCWCEAVATVGDPR
eukprot:scaffold50906_cov56-Phaeocystis_antarctica.AAC.2